MGGGHRQARPGSAAAASDGRAGARPRRGRILVAGGDSSLQTSARGAAILSRRMIAAAVVGAGLALLTFAVGADRNWFSRHVLLPFFFMEPRGIVVAVRVAAVVAAVALFVAAPAIVRLHEKRGPS